MISAGSVLCNMGKCSFFFIFLWHMN